MLSQRVTATHKDILGFVDCAHTFLVCFPMLPLLGGVLTLPFNTASQFLKLHRSPQLHVLKH